MSERQFTDDDLEHFVDMYVAASLFFLPCLAPGTEKHGKRGNVSGTISASTI